MKYDWGSYYNLKGISIGSFLSNIFSHKELFERIVLLKPKKILEVGSGSGAMCIFLSWLGYDVISVDNDENVLLNAEKLTKRLNGRCRYDLIDVFTLSKHFKFGEFDIVFSQGFFEHFTDEQIIQLIDEQLKVSSRIIFSVPSYYYRRLDLGNERLMRESRWRKLLKRYNIVFITPYHPKSRGIKSLLFDFFIKPWRFLPWRQPEHFLIEITSQK